jgi:cell division transport system permease protein
MIFRLAFKHLFSKPILSIFTLLAVSGSLTILGVFWTIVENLERVRTPHAVTSSGEPAPGVTVFVDARLGPPEVESLKQKLLAGKKFSKVEVVPASVALKALEQQYGETLSKVFSNESLPTTLTLQYADASLKQEEYAALMNSLRSTPGVLEVDDGLGSTNTERVTLSKRIFSWATALLAVVFILVALLVSHLIRIAFESLKPEVETLKILGASKFWIFRPLLLEGLVLGFAGATLALGTLALCMNVLFPRFVATLLPKGLTIASLSMYSTLGLFVLGVGASIVGAIFTWPLIQRAPTEV